MIDTTITIPTFNAMLSGTGAARAAIVLTKANGNESMAVWTGKDADGTPVTLTISQNPVKAGSDNYGRVSARVKLVMQRSEQLRSTIGLTSVGDPVRGSKTTDTIVDVKINLPVALADPEAAYDVLGYVTGLFANAAVGPRVCIGSL